MLYATGLTQEDMPKPQVGVGSIWYDGNPATCIYWSWYFDTQVVPRTRAWSGIDLTRLVSQMAFPWVPQHEATHYGPDLIMSQVETVVGAQWYDGP